MRHLLFSLALATAPVFAGEFPEPYDSEPDTGETPLPAHEAAATMNVPEGFSVNVFAAEPEVRNPIAMTWDKRGRMWVAENFTYAERAKRFELGLRDRVLILEDTDHDGTSDQRTVFTDDVQMLTSVEVGRGGVWLMCPPQLLFIPDENGDDLPDGPPEVMLDGFTVAESNYHNFANGLNWGPDGWLYGRCGHSCPGNVGVPGTPEEERVRIKGGIWRFDPVSKRFEGLTHGTTNPWGHDWDEHGELFFINTVNGHLWHMIPGAHFKESFGVDPNPYVYERLDTIADHWHWDTGGKWSDSREGAADQFGGGHAHIGAMIYQADQFPEDYRNKLFTLNLHGRRANVEKLERRGSGFVGKHDPDVFLAEDEWFRGMEISTGPDGAAYILDWSDTGECHDHTGVHRSSGRIYRVAYSKSVKTDFSTLENMDIPALLSASNDWFTRQGRLKLAGNPVAADPLVEAALDSDLEAVARLRALWALMTMRQPEAEDVARKFLDDSNESLRKWGIAALTDGWEIDHIAGPPAKDSRVSDPERLDTFIEMAETDDSGLVRLQLASTLQRLPVEDRGELGVALASRTEDADDQNLPTVVWWGVAPLVKADPEKLVAIADATEWPVLVGSISRALAHQMDEEPGALDSLLSLSSSKDGAWRSAVVSGMNEGLLGWRTAAKPTSWDAFIASSIKDPASADIRRELSALFGDGRALDAIRETVLDNEAELAVRTAALETLIEARPDYLRELCQTLLDVRVLNTTAVRGLALFDDDGIGKALAARYRRFYPAERASVIETLVSRPAWAAALLNEIKNGKINKSDLTPFHARQIQAFADEELTALLSAVWGDSRETSREKRALIASLHETLSTEHLNDADLPNGRMLYQGICAACHKLYDEGGQIGPDLTGSGRANLDYLLENIVDPGAVVGADHRMSILQLKDGRTITGVVSEENDRTVTLELLAGTETIEKERISKREISPMSMMPEGLLQALSEEQVRDLIAYLMHPTQVPLPGQ